MFMNNSNTILANISVNNKNKILINLNITYPCKNYFANVNRIIPARVKTGLEPL